MQKEMKSLLLALPAVALLVSTSTLPASAQCCNSANYSGYTSPPSLVQYSATQPAYIGAAPWPSGLGWGAGYFGGYFTGSSLGYLPLGSDVDLANTLYSPFSRYAALRGNYWY